MEYVNHMIATLCGGPAPTVVESLFRTAEGDMVSSTSSSSFDLSRTLQIVAMLVLGMSVCVAAILHFLAQQSESDASRYNSQAKKIMESIRDEQSVHQRYIDDLRQEGGKVRSIKEDLTTVLLSKKGRASRRVAATRTLRSMSARLQDEFTGRAAEASEAVVESAKARVVVAQNARNEALRELDEVDQTYTEMQDEYDALRDEQQAEIEAALQERHAHLLSGNGLGYGGEAAVYRVEKSDDDEDDDGSDSATTTSGTDGDDEVNGNDRGDEAELDDAPYDDMSPNARRYHELLVNEATSVERRRTLESIKSDAAWLLKENQTLERDVQRGWKEIEVLSELALEQDDVIRELTDTLRAAETEAVTGMASQVVASAENDAIECPRDELGLSPAVMRSSPPSAGVRPVRSSTPTDQVSPHREPMHLIASPAPPGLTIQEQAQWLAGFVDEARLALGEAIEEFEAAGENQEEQEDDETAKVVDDDQVGVVTAVMTANGVFDPVPLENEGSDPSDDSSSSSETEEPEEEDDVEEAYLPAPASRAFGAAATGWNRNYDVKSTSVVAKAQQKGGMSESETTKVGPRTAPVLSSSRHNRREVYVNKEN